MKPRVLWIEDSARFELNNLTGPIYFYGKYDFQQVEDITTAVNFLLARPFDVLIVDVRLPPGNDPYWRDLYQNVTADGGGEKLGIKFLYWLLSRDGEYQQTPPDWVSADQIGVFTVENYQEIQEKLDALEIKVFKHKSAGLSDTTLLDLIEEILEKKSGGKKRRQ
ncbi:MAG: hypothetical protein C3F07_20855 [Anaerolineales bacterium]|nr:hypothetical protein [Anaerolineae bacterium]PWB68914.1 MAG: hypothetical protein C3F07_20855 [Anaerolineales bacterium]